MLIPIIILNNWPAVARLWSRERENNKTTVDPPFATALQNLFDCNLPDTDTHAEQPGRPLKTYLKHLARGELAYQFSPEAGRAVFYPRMLCPFTGSDRLEYACWRRIPLRDGAQCDRAYVATGGLHTFVRTQRRRRARAQ
jgi:hypothetical protein